MPTWLTIICWVLGIYFVYRLILWDSYLAALNDGDVWRKDCLIPAMALWVVTIWFVLFGLLCHAIKPGEGLDKAIEAGKARRIAAAEGRDPHLPIPHEEQA